MTEEDLAELARATQELRLKQETPDSPEALRSVPSLSLQDIPKKPTHVPTNVMSFVFENYYVILSWMFNVVEKYLCNILSYCRLVRSME